MEIKWKQVVTLSVTSDYDEGTDTATENSETFLKGSCCDVDITEERGEFVDMQFGNGSMAFNVFKGLYEEI